MPRSRLFAAVLFMTAALAFPAPAAYAPGSAQDHVANQLNAQELNRVRREYPLYGPTGGGYPPPPHYAPYGGYPAQPYYPPPGYYPPP